MIETIYLLILTMITLWDLSEKYIDWKYSPWKHM